MEMPSPCDTSNLAGLEPTAVLEALLFLSGQPMKRQDISKHTGWSLAEIDQTAQELGDILARTNRGLAILRVAGGYQLVTKPALHEAIQWVRTGTTELTPMALEVLSIVAFKQPITRAEIEKLRGVSSERVLSTLIEEGLVTELGRKESPGRPILYGTTPYFLECIGMDSLADLGQSVPLAATTETTEDRDGTVTESNE